MPRCRRIQLSTLALSHCLPGGNAMGYSLGYRLLMRAGVGGTDTAVALATQGLGSAVVLNVIFWLALLVSLPLYGLQSGYLFVAVIGMLLMAAIASLVILLTKGDQRAMGFCDGDREAGAVPPPRDPAQALRPMVGRVKELVQGPPSDGEGALFCLCQLVVRRRFPVRLRGRLRALGKPCRRCLSLTASANIVAALPITPGGLGVVEATVSGILVGFGTPRSIAIWGVLAWRLVNFWLPIPIGGSAYLSLQLHPPAGTQAGLAARRAMWRARWRWVVQVFRSDTQTPVVEDSLPIIGKAVGEEVAGDGKGNGVPTTVAPADEPQRWR